MRNSQCVCAVPAHMCAMRNFCFYCKRKLICEQNSYSLCTLPQQLNNQRYLYVYANQQHSSMTTIVLMFAHRIHNHKICPNSWKIYDFRFNSHLRIERTVIRSTRFSEYRRIKQRQLTISIMKTRKNKVQMKLCSHLRCLFRKSFGNEHPCLLTICQYSMEYTKFTFPQ